MSPHISIELAELRKQLALDIKYQNRQRQNERRIVSRNKREGWYIGRRLCAEIYAGGIVSTCRKHIRIADKDLSMRHRHKTGKQIAIARARVKK
jgi:hypothetical protein